MDPFARTQYILCNLQSDIALKCRGAFRGYASCVLLVSLCPRKGSGHSLGVWGALWEVGYYNMVGWNVLHDILNEHRDGETLMLGGWVNQDNILICLLACGVA